MVTHVLGEDDLLDLVSPLEVSPNGHTAYPPGACSPVHPSGCLRCLEAENTTLKRRLQDANVQITMLQAQAEELAALLAKK